MALRIFGKACLLEGSRVRISGGRCNITTAIGLTPCTALGETCASPDTVRKRKARSVHIMTSLLDISREHHALPEFSTDGTPSNSATTRQRDQLLARFSDRIAVNPDLSRSLVSWQSNRDAPGFRWFKFKEGFSAALVRYLLGFLDEPGCLLDPFAGTGIAPITAARVGWQGIGVEILPVGVNVSNALLAAPAIDLSAFGRQASAFLKYVATAPDAPAADWFPHIRITERAFPSDSEAKIAAARNWLRRAESAPETDLLALAAMAALEDASWTSKDGQYLRWDHRSGRKLKAKMEKRHVLPYEVSLRNRIDNIAADLPTLSSCYKAEDVRIIESSCYDALPDLPTDSVDAVITSPPYANRYDYTRTYALELAWLGYDNQGISTLRQRLLSATVENRSKREQLAADHGDALARFDQHGVITEITDALENANQRGELPNPHVIRLVRNYFMEMSVVIADLSRVCRPGASIFMVNDNVQYHGEEVPVDLILSDLAEQCGFHTKAIWTLARGKGNASQQMGRFGRKELRKCVYWWVRR